MAQKDNRKNSNLTLGLEQSLWVAADKMPGHMDASEYKHVARRHQTRGGHGMSTLFSIPTGLHPSAQG